MSELEDYFGVGVPVETVLPGMLKSFVLEAVAYVAEKLRDGDYQMGLTDSASIESINHYQHIEVWQDVPDETHHTAVDISRFSTRPPLITATRETFTGLEGEDKVVTTKYSADPSSKSTLSPLSVANTLLIARRFQRA